MKKNKLFIVLIVIVLLFLFLKLNSKKEDKVIVTSNNTNKNITNNDISEENEITSIPVNPIKVIDQIDEKELTPEEISNLDHEDYLEYHQTLTIEEQESLPPLAAMMNQSFPYEEESFLAKKYENLKVYAQSKIDDKAKAERDLQYWYFTEIGITLPSEGIIWE